MPPTRYATGKDFENMGFLPSPGIGSGGSVMKGTLFSGSGFGLQPSLPTIGEQLNKANNLVGANVTPADRIAQLESDYKAGKIPFSKLFEQYQLPSRYPAVTNTTTGAFSDVGAVDKAVGLPDFNSLKKEFGGASADMNQWYNRYQAGNDISGYAAGQRAADQQASTLTGTYSGIARGQLGDAAGVIDRYRTEGLGALDKYTANASDFYNKDIPASIANALKEATGYTSRYAMGRGGGMGSDVAAISGAAAVRAALPFQLQGRQYMGDALSRYQPFYGDVAARDYSRIAGLNVPVEQNIYGAQQGDVLRQKSTEQHIQNLDMMVKERGLNAAIANLRNQGLSQSLINSLVGEWQAQKARTLGLAGQAAGMEQQYGAESGYKYIPGANVQNPQYFGLPQPNYPNNSPGRYPTENPQANPVGSPGGYANGNMNTTGYAGAPMSDEQRDINRVMNYTAGNSDLGSATPGSPQWDRYAFRPPTGDVNQDNIDRVLQYSWKQNQKG